MYLSSLMVSKWRHRKTFYCECWGPLVQEAIIDLPKLTINNTSISFTHFISYCNNSLISSIKGIYRWSLITLTATRLCHGLEKWSTVASTLWFPGSKFTVRYWSDLSISCISRVKKVRPVPFPTDTFASLQQSDVILHWSKVVCRYATSTY